jgi:hypothetical protein
VQRAAALIAGRRQPAWTKLAARLIALFLRPDLVGPIRQAKPETGASFRDLAELAKRPDWPG